MFAVSRPKTTKAAKVCCQQTHNNSFGFIIKSVTGNLWKIRQAGQKLPAGKS